MPRSHNAGPSRGGRRGAALSRFALATSLALPLLAGACASRTAAPGEAVIPSPSQERLPPWPTRGPVMLAQFA